MKTNLIRLVIIVALALAHAGCSVESRKAKLLERISAYYKAGEYEKAEIECRNLLQLDRENITALEHFGMIWLERGAPMRALPFLVTVRSKQPENRQIENRLMHLNLALGKLGDARKDALRILQRTSDDPDAILVLARAARSKEDLEGVEKALARGRRGSVAHHLATANLQMRQGDVKAAAISLRHAQAAEPKSPQVRAAQAALRLWSNELKQAGAELKAAAELAPPRSDDKIRYADFLVQTGATAEATRLLREVTSQAPDYLPAWRGLAYTAIAEKKYDEAQAYLQKIFARDPENYEGRLAKARLLLAQGLSARSVDELVAVGKQFPMTADDKFLLAQAYLAQGDVPNAAAALRNAVTQNPDHVDAILTLARLQLSGGAPAAAATAVSEILAQQPGNLPAQMLYLEAMKELGRLADAAEGIRVQIAAAPERVELHRLLGLVLIQLQKPEEARKSLERSLELTPGYLPVVAELVALDLKEKNFTAAAKRVQAEKLRTPSALVNLLEARVLAAEGRWGDADPILQKLLDDGSQPPAVIFDLLRKGYVARGNSAEAMAQLERFLEQRREDARAAQMGSAVYRELKQYNKSREALEKHLAARPDSPVVLNNLAYLLVEDLNEPDRGLELARKARQLDAASPEIADTLGWILYKRAAYPEAFDLLKEAALRSPNNGEIQYHLGLAAQKLDRADVARMAFERAQRDKADFPAKAEIPKRLAELPAPADSSGAQGAQKVSSGTP